MNRNSPGSPAAESSGTGVSVASGRRTDRWLPFLAADALYLLILFGWTLRLGPMGKDFIRLPEATAGTGHWFFTVFSGWFQGPSVLIPRLAALVLLYGVVGLTFRLTRSVTSGPWWLGSVAAVLFLAHPLKSEAVYTVTGITALADSLLLLSAVWSLEASGQGGPVRKLTGWLVPPLVAWLTGRWWEALVLTAGWAWIRRSAGPGGILRVMPAALAILSGGLYHCSWDPMALFGLLHGGRAWLLTVWPFGLSPDTARFFEGHPGWHAAWSLAVWGGMILVTWRFAGGTAARLAALTLPVCLAAGARLDFQTFEGGTAYVVPTVLTAMVVAAGFRAQLDHPRFRQRTVAVSTGVCLALMAWHSWLALDWVHADRLLKKGLAEAAGMPDNEPLAVFPDVWRVGCAPARLAEALRCPPPFCPGREAYALAWVELDHFLTRSAAVPEYGPEGGVIQLMGTPEARPWTGFRLEPTPAVPDSWEILQRILMPRRPRPADTCTRWRISPWQTPFPQHRVAFP